MKAFQAFGKEAPVVADSGIWLHHLPLFGMELPPLFRRQRVALLQELDERLGKIRR